MNLSGELARSLLDAAPDATIVVAEGGNIEFANAQVSETFGYTPEELVGRPVEVLLPQRFRDVHPEHRLAFAARPRQRPMGAGLALFGLHKDGREFPVQISLSPVKTPDGTLVVAAIRDATEQKTTEHRLVEANRQKSRFLAAASHDLRQPLQTLNLLNRVATHEAGLHPRLKKLLERQQQALDSMSGLLASVLDISKLDSGVVAPKRVPFALSDILMRLRSNFEPLAADKGIELAVERSELVAHTDPELLHRIIGNLLSNAIRYTERGTVRVSCNARGALLEISVSDTGVGIPADQIELIFEEFYQIDSGSQRPDGLGLGLSIVRRLAQLLGLKLDVRSTPDRGTTFTIGVPAGELPQRAAEQPAATGGTTGGLILVIDDEPAVAEATGLLLELEGFDVKIASCEREALEHVRERPPDLLVSDYHLRGGETGLGVVQSVRDELAADVPAVFLTGDTGRSTIEASALARVRLLTKPLRGDELLSTIKDELTAGQR